MAIDTTLPQVQPGIASFATESFANADEPRYGEGVPTDTVRNVTAGADIDLALYTVVSLIDGVLAKALWGQAATLDLTFSGVGTANDTVTIDGVVYTLKAAPTTVAGEVKIGATAAATAANLAAAINLTGTPGTDYGSLTVVHPSVSASVAGAVVTVTAKVAGDEGNAIVVAEAGTGASWAGGATALAGGDEDPDISGRPFGILAAPISMTNGQVMDVPIYRQGHWDMNALVWDATFDTDDKKKRAFEGSHSPTIFISKKKFRNADIAI